MALTCPACGSTDTRRAAVAYEQGHTEVIHGGELEWSGPSQLGRGSYEGRTTQTSAFAARLAPPRAPVVGPALLVAWSFFALWWLGCWVFGVWTGWQPNGAAPEGFVSLVGRFFLPASLSFFFILLLPVLLLTGVLWRWQGRRWRRHDAALEGWRRTWVCARCGRWWTPGR